MLWNSDPNLIPASGMCRWHPLITQLLHFRPLLIQSKYAFEDLIIGEIGGPAIGSADGGIKIVMGKLKPRRPLSVKFCQRPVLLEAV